jgi:hypothetical protein
MLPFSFRKLIFLVQALVIVSPLLRRGRKQNLPLLLKEAIFLVISNWALIWKLIEKRRWTIEALKELKKGRNRR